MSSLIVDPKHGKAGMTTLAELNALVQAHSDTFEGIAAAYETLLYGVPSINGFAYLINNAIATNYGAHDNAIEFNRENIFINITNALVLGNDGALQAFQKMMGEASTLSDKILAIVDDLVPGSVSDAGRAYLTRPEALSFYENVAVERGVAGPDGSAVVALASILDIIVRENRGMGDAVNDLVAAISNGSADLPQRGKAFTPIGIADGFDFDSSDPEPAEPIIYPFPAIAPDNGEPETVYIYTEPTGRYAHKFDFTDFIGESSFTAVAAGEIGTGDGFDANVNIILVYVDSNVTSAGLTSLIGNDATDLRLRDDSNTVVIIDADGQVGGQLHAFYVVTDQTGDTVDVQLVGILNTFGVALTEDHFV